jgi:hypothetical protein
MMNGWFEVWSLLLIFLNPFSQDHWYNNDFLTLFIILQENSNVKILHLDWKIINAVKILKDSS